MVVACDLEVDVNGEEIFLVAKDILSAFSGRLGKLFSNPSVTATTQTLKVIFHDFPGGATGFEIMSRFCYNNGRPQITSSNACLLHCVAEYMGMTEDVSSCPNLIMLTEECLRGIPNWSCSDIMNTLKQCQEFLSAAISSGIVDRITDSLVGRITTASDTSPSGSSPESSAFQSSDTRSTKSNSSYRAWWFEKLAVLNPDMIQKVIATMVSQKVDNVMISRFLFYYLKCGAYSYPEAEKMKRKATEIVIDLLYSLDRSSVSCKGLFEILRVSSSLSLSKFCRSRTENMIGSLIDQATLDNLLIPAPSGMDSLYDVNLVLRFLRSFLRSRDRASLTRLKQVGSLIDSYMAEVAPDSSLKPTKFIALSAVLPEDARDSHEALYRAIDLYLEVHARLSKEDKMKICCAINYEKLSSESCKHLSRNLKFPWRTAVKALISQQSKAKLKSLIQDTNHSRKIGSETPKQHKNKENEFDESEQIVVYGNELDLSMENEEFKDHWEGMQWKVMQWEKICRKMQIQMAKVMKNKMSRPSGSRSLPRICS